MLGVLALARVAHAGGYDTPMLYSARHMGMGGTAIGYVDDASALFHNPAGLAHTPRLALLADFSLLLARVHASPGLLAEDLDSKLAVAPLGLLGAAYRLTDRITVGVGAYPVASAGATYEYPLVGAKIENSTRLLFIEASPAVAVNLPGRVRLAAAYRVTYVSLTRFQGDRSAAVPFLDFHMTGFDWTGFRVGAQWTALDWLQVGAVYRHKTNTVVKNDAGIALGQRFTDIESSFLLPSKAGLGARADLGDFGIALDGEYLWGSQNVGAPLEGLPPAADPAMPPMRLAVPNVFAWSDEITVRAGVEYRLLRGQGGAPRLALRAGYVHDGKVTNARYPSAFGTPPGPTHVLTFGAGWNAGPWQVNAAFARRFGEGAVTNELVSDPANKPCRFCGVAGMDPYRITINAFYVDFSRTW
jgi:long-subunit fatty acid transport protein